MSLSTTATSTTDVLIIGASPAGLVLACELLRRDIACRLIDQSVTHMMTSRAVGLHPRTLELLDQLDVLDEILAQGQPLYSIVAYSDGNILTHVLLDMSEQNTRYNALLMLPQTEVEKILRARVKDLGGQIEYGMQIQEINQDEQSVLVILKNAEGYEERIAASWIVGCDGPQSTVRRQLGLLFEGDTTEPWLIADAKIEWGLKRDTQDSLYLFFSKESSVIALPFAQEDCWRLIDTAPDLTETTSAQEVGVQLTRKIQEASGYASLVVHDPQWTSIFKIQRRAVPALRSGRGFVIGDAAHGQSPLDSQEQNGDIQDAFNLAWKLALVCKKSTSEAFLATYQAERQPIAVECLQQCRLVTQFLGMHEADARTIRDLLVTTIAQTESLRNTVLKRAIPAFAELQNVYQAGSFLSEDWTQDPGKLTSTNGGFAPGARVPDFLFGGAVSRRLLSVVGANYYSLLIFTGKDVSLEELQAVDELAHHVHVHYRKFLTVHLVVPSVSIQKELRWQGSVLLDVGNPNFTLHQQFGAYATSLYLIRPDGYVGYRSQPADRPKLLAYLEKILVGDEQEIDPQDNAALEKILHGAKDEREIELQDDSVIEQILTGPADPTQTLTAIEEMALHVPEESPQSIPVAEQPAPPETVTVGRPLAEMQSSIGGDQSPNGLRMWARLLSTGIPQGVM